ncbi:hypothetical protein ACLOJK_009162 [Asimina triloba]
MFLKLVHAPTIVVLSADVARKIMKGHDLAFSSRPPNLMAEKLMQARKICALQSLGSKKVELFRPVREEEIALFIHKIRWSSVTKGVVKYGPLMFLKLVHAPTIVVLSADVARKIMKGHDLAFSSRPPNLMVEKLMYGIDIVFAPYGVYWRQAKKICALQLLGSKKVELFRPVREEEIALFIHKIR